MNDTKPNRDRAAQAGEAQSDSEQGAVLDEVSRGYRWGGELL
jgi:hypothetical protein